MIENFGKREEKKEESIEIHIYSMPEGDWGVHIGYPLNVCSDGFLSKKDAFAWVVTQLEEGK